MSAHLLTLYTRTPLHAGCGLSVDVVDLPFARERVTQFPIIPSPVLRSVLRNAGRQHFGPEGEAQVRQLFGGESGSATTQAGSVQILEARLLAFPVRALKGCFAWLTCPAILHRFARDTGKLAAADVPSVAPDRALVATKSDLVREEKLFLEEYRLQADREPANAHRAAVAALRPLSDDSLWQSRLSARLAILNDDDFQHFVTTCTEIVQRVAPEPGTTAKRSGQLLSQENLPCESLFYSVLTFLPSPPADGTGPGSDLSALLDAALTLQIDDEKTTGLGFCAVKHEPIP